MTLNSILKECNEIISQPFEWEDLDKEMIKLHTLLAEDIEPKWAIEDPLIREETEKLFINYVVGRLRNGK